MKISHLLVLAFGLALPISSTLAAADAPPTRERLSLNAAWRFHKGDPDGTGDQLSYGKLKDWLLPTSNPFVEPTAVKAPPSGEAPGAKVEYTQPGFSDASWRTLNLPHDWGIEGPFDQALPGETGKLPWFGVGWYRKTFQLPASDRGRQMYLQIDGAMSYSAVWCNGKLVGGWPYGYSSYQLDLTPYLKPGGSNTLAIRLDNPGDSSRWYPGSGIYRNVWLLKTAPVAIAHWGTHVTTPEISSSFATVKIAMQIDSASMASTNFQVRTQIFRLVPDKTGGTTRVPDAVSAIAAGLVAGGKSTVISQSVSVNKPALWSPATPNRYLAVTSIAVNNKVVDSYDTPFGIRTATFTANNGLQINGQRVPIQGVCMHHDLGALGSAFNARAEQRQLEILKEMGVNAIRTSHNPPAPEMLDLCDKMGIMVMDEFVDCWKRGKKPNGYQNLFEDWSQQDVRAFVRRDRNHPSVIMWSMGNEINEQSEREGPAMAKQLSAYAHQEDPSRPTGMGVSDGGAGYNGFQKGMDVFGYNYKPWEYPKFHKENPNQPLFGSETSSTISSRGEYVFPVSGNRDEGKSDFQVSSYDLYAPSWATLPETEFKGQDENPFVAGEFVWTGFDYLGEPTPYNSDVTNLLNYHTPEAKAAAEKELKELGKISVPSRSSYFGIVDIAGFKKDRFYLYQARWRPTLPMAHILPHWNWPERVGEVTPVHVYTSGDEAELFLNNKSLGRKKMGKYEYRLRWDDVKYEPGELKVVVYKEGRSWAQDIVRTTGPAAGLLLKPDRAVIRADGRDLSYITLTVADKTGTLVPRSKNPITFSISGPGEIIATDNGDPTDQTVFSAPNRKAFNGLALAIVRSKPGAPGPITIRANTAGLPAAQVVVNSQ